ncbi:MAG: GNAT family N-acetyltransferase [Acidimicrobiaceae bacterium]|nr:GNAT family N-acetyltransferase [Acidimicrobiaceae bacterium]
MSLSQLTIGDARFRAGPWQGRAELAALIPLSDAPTLHRKALRAARTVLRNQGFTAVVTSPLSPAQRTAFLRDDFSEREHLHLLRHDLQPRPLAGSATGERYRPWQRRQLRTRRATRRDWDHILAVDQQAFDDFWHFDRDGLEDSIEATPVSRLRVARGTAPANPKDPGDPTPHTRLKDPAHPAPHTRLKDPGDPTADAHPKDPGDPAADARPKEPGDPAADAHPKEPVGCAPMAPTSSATSSPGPANLKDPAGRASDIRSGSRSGRPGTPSGAHSKELLGYALAGHFGDSGYLQRLAVHPACRQQGIGTLLVCDALRWIRRRGAVTGWVNTQTSNKPALRLYQKLGFTLQEHPLTVMYRTLT